MQSDTNRSVTFSSNIVTTTRIAFIYVAISSYCEHTFLPLQDMRRIYYEEFDAGVDVDMAGNRWCASRQRIKD